MAETELSVVCKSCGSEVSPYVTECPYCGARLRRRAPKLERRGDELQARETRRARRRRRAAERAASRDLPWLGTGRPYATIAAILAPAVLLVVQRASDLSAFDLGAIAGRPDVATDWWRYLAAPFVYTDAGYLFVVAVAVAIFVPPLERRLGAIPTALLIVACGALGALAAPALDDALGDGLVVVGGGNGVALGALGAWFALRRADAAADPTEEVDWIPVAVAAAVLLALPLADDFANPWAGIVGGLVGLGAGFSAARGGR
jgi:membrane associated rhomboid family serine protease